MIIMRFYMLSSLKKKKRIAEVTICDPQDGDRSKQHGSLLFISFWALFLGGSQLPLHERC